ncbi:toll-like receptor 4 [Mytilus californianus]|uniref:toll-like receptor 4 n=1 Tax=Mytilus californianus TaxID=6549 RepID=UPI002247A521|nr:toll-like receptor 4 [Mytilus californianus]
MRNISELDVSLNTCLGFPALENITTDIMQSAIKVLKVNYIYVPRKLRTFLIRSSRLKYEIPHVSFTENELNNLSLSDNALHTWTGPVYNVKNLTSLDLSSNTCSNVSKSFFSPDFNNLKTLLLQDNNLGHVIPLDSDGEILKNLNNVVYINLSKNKIQNIPNLFFKKQHNLEHLDLNENMIKDITFKVSHMKKLMFLNLRNNQISKLNPLINVRLVQGSYAL